MNKVQALNSFWSSFQLVAYDENSVPEEAPLPYITYETSVDDFNHEIALTANLWYRDTSWKDITEKEMEISTYIGRGGRIKKYDGGAFWIKKGTPWAQRLPEQSDDMVRRIVMNYTIEYID